MTRPTGRKVPRPRGAGASAPALSTPAAGGYPRLFPVVGIGASAGGLEALGLFLTHMPPDTGMAFVVVQHLDPVHKGIMPELLQRATTMPVAQIRDRTKIEPNHVYVIPPNADLSVLHGTLHLLEPVAPRGLRLPIDHFFRSLADDQHEQGFGVILSGMGSDGSLGLRAIKENSGAIFVQDPASAKFQGMPRSAVDSGLADVVAAVEELPARILAYLQHVPALQPGAETRAGAEAAGDRDKSGLEKVIILLRAQTGHDFSLYKKSTTYRRIERRMGLHQLARIADYVRFLRQNPQETELLFKELLIGVTGFFRDPPVWADLVDEALPALLAAHPRGAALRAWCPGVSTGEEAYSLAMAFRAAVERLDPGVPFTLQVFATDLNKEAVDKARKGVYPANIAADVSEDRLRRHFIEEEGGYRVSKEIREMVVFAPQNLVMDPPFTKLDILSCRNLLIYLEPALQEKLLPLFHYSLNPGGLLVLGNSETIGAAGDLFEPLPGKTRLFRRREAGLAPGAVEFPSAFVSHRFPVSQPTLAAAAQPSSGSLQRLTETILLQHFSPAAVLATGSGDIVYFSGRTGRYLEPAAGKANLNLFAMAREGLAGALSDSFTKAVREKITVTIHEVVVEGDGVSRMIDITVQPLNEPADLRGMALVVFRDAPPAAVAVQSGRPGRASGRDAQRTALGAELQHAREELRISREEMQASQEELKSANEELQSTNEELQSTNEELTTSKEEMQSMNEELETVNHELQARVTELSRAGDDMENLLNSTDIATLFLGNDLRVRRFTRQVADIIKLIPGDAGRPITDIVSDLEYPGFGDDVREVLRSLVFQVKQVPAAGNRWFQVRIMPYRAQGNRIDGVVVTFTDISETKSLEIALREARHGLQASFDVQSRELGDSRQLEVALKRAVEALEARLTGRPEPLR